MIFQSCKYKLSVCMYVCMYVCAKRKVYDKHYLIREKTWQGVRIK